MVLNNLISIEEIKKFSHPNEIDRYISSIFGLKDSDLEWIRKQDEIIESLDVAGKVLKERLKEKYGNDVNIGAQFTGANLVLLTGCSMYRLEQCISNIYGRKRKIAEEKTGLRIPNMQLFREDMGVYEGNLYEAKKRWEKIEVSSVDWLTSVRLPLEVDFQLAYLIGIIFADGNTENRGLQITGRENDKEFYEKVVQPLIRSKFNKRTTIVDKLGHPNNPTNPETHSPVIILASRAVETFMQYHMGFPSKKENYRVPKFYFAEQKSGLFAGILAGAGAIGETLTITDKDGAFVKSIQGLAKELGFNAHLIKYSTRGAIEHQLQFYQNDIKRLYQQGYLRHPKFYLNPLALMQKK